MMKVGIWCKLELKRSNMTDKFYTFCKRVGSKIFVRGIKDGKRFTAKVDYSPSLWVQTRKETQWKTLQGDPLDQVTFDSIRDADDYKKRYSDVSNMEIFGDIEYHYQYLHEKYPEVVDYDFTQLRIWVLDIETTVERGFPDYKNPTEEILVITVTDVNSGEVWTFGRKPLKSWPEGVNYNSDPDEAEMLERFISHWNANCPDIVTGWNTDEFDVPYLVERINRVCGENASKRLSPYGMIDTREYEVMGDQKVSYDLVGVSHLDYLDLYQKFALDATPENYKLDTIGELEVGENKHENPFDTFKSHYEKDWDSFVAYNIQDTRLVVKIDKKRNLLRLATSMAYTAKINYQDVYSPVKSWDVIIYNYLRYKNIIVPNRKHTGQEGSIEGAFVKDPIVGMHEWIVSYDLNSLYPSIIMTLNMSPETVQSRVLDVTVEELLEGDRSKVKPGYSLAANGAMFDMSKSGFLAELMSKYYNTRKAEKKKMLGYQQDLENEKHTATKERINELESLISAKDTLQNAMKTLLNSAYGATANKGFRFFDHRIAEGITKTGQLIIQTAERNANMMLNKLTGIEKDRVVASDTDSLYSVASDLIDKFVPNKTKEEKAAFLERAASERIAPQLNKGLSDLAESMNWKSGLLVFKLEVVADKGVYVAKKRYALHIFSSEGVRFDKPKIKVKGLEIVRSSTPTKIREMLKKSVEIILTKEESDFRMYVAQCEKEFMKLPVEDISFPRSANNLVGYSNPSTIYSKGTPMHVKGALIYNHYIDEHKLQTKYSKIREGEKIKFVNLRQPNRIHDAVIAFNGKLPPEFGVHDAVDYDLMFKKTYLDPLDTIVSKIGWKTKEEGNLDSLWD